MRRKDFFVGLAILACCCFLFSACAGSNNSKETTNNYYNEGDANQPSGGGSADANQPSVDGVPTGSDWFRYREEPGRLGYFFLSFNIKAVPEQNRLGSPYSGGSWNNWKYVFSLSSSRFFSGWLETQESIFFPENQNVYGTWGYGPGNGTIPKEQYARWSIFGCDEYSAVRVDQTGNMAYSFGWKRTGHTLVPIPKSSNTVVPASLASSAVIPAGLSGDAEIGVETEDSGGLEPAVDSNSVAPVYSPDGEINEVVPDSGEVNPATDSNSVAPADPNSLFPDGDVEEIIEEDPNSSSGNVTPAMDPNSVNPADPNSLVPDGLDTEEIPAASLENPIKIVDGIYDYGIISQAYSRLFGNLHFRWIVDLATGKRKLLFNPNDALTPIGVPYVVGEVVNSSWSCVELGRILFSSLCPGWLESEWLSLSSWKDFNFCYWDGHTRNYAWYVNFSGSGKDENYNPFVRSDSVRDSFRAEFRNTIGDSQGGVYSPQ